MCSRCIYGAAARNTRLAITAPHTQIALGTLTHSTLEIVCDNHGLLQGRMYIETFIFVPDVSFNDGNWKKVFTLYPDILLVNGNGDEKYEATANLKVNQSIIDAYDKEVDGGYTGTLLDYIAALNETQGTSERIQFKVKNGYFMYTVDSGKTWTNLYQVNGSVVTPSFRTDDGYFEVSADGGSTWAKIYKLSDAGAKPIFRVKDGNVEMSIDDDGTWKAVFSTYDIVNDVFVNITESDYAALVAAGTVDETKMYYITE